jgi:hypothetical protein
VFDATPPWLGAVCLRSSLHEASHRFAGTIDYVYFKDDTVNVDEVVGGGNFDDKAKALNNADSYGWFIIKAGRSHSGFTSSMYS